MTYRQRRYVAVCLPLSGLLAWLFLGIYRDREFGDRYLFIKHRPTLKLRFYAPCGESDRGLPDLPPQQASEELLYREYVEAHGGYRRSLRIPG